MAKWLGLALLATLAWSAPARAAEVMGPPSPQAVARFVVNEDTPNLSAVALYLYGRTSMAMRIAEWNSLPNPNRIRRGQTLLLRQAPTLSREQGQARLLAMWRRKFGLAEEKAAVAAAKPAPPAAAREVANVGQSYEAVEPAPPSTGGPPAPAEPAAPLRADTALAPEPTLVVEEAEPEPDPARIEAERARTQGVALEKDGDVNGAVLAFRRGREENPQDIASWMGEMRVLANGRDRREAAEVARQFVDTHPALKALPFVRGLLEEEPPPGGS